MRVTCLVCLLAVLMSPFVAMADGAAHGTDMWTRTFEQWGLFNPHEDYCDSSTEVFVSISGSAQRGFCIEKNSRTAATFEDARDDCASDKKRLPESAEWKFACKNAAGLSGMTGGSTTDYEWTSNFPILLYGHGLAAPVHGYTNCYGGNFGWVSYSGGTGTEDSYTYRCVR